MLLLFIILTSSTIVSELLWILLNGIHEYCLYWRDLFLDNSIKIKKPGSKWYFQVKRNVQISVKKSVSYLHVCMLDFILPDVLTSGKLLSMPMMSGDIYCLVWKSDADWKLC